MDVIAWSQNLTQEKAASAGARLVMKEQLFTEADYVIIHLVLSDRSRSLVGAADLARMKPTAYLVYTSRGPIVDEAALPDALRNRRIAGAGLDVYDVEPLPADHTLLSLDNVLFNAASRLRHQRRLREVLRRYRRERRRLPQRHPDPRAKRVGASGGWSQFFGCLGEAAKPWAAR